MSLAEEQSSTISGGSETHFELKSALNYEELFKDRLVCSILSIKLLFYDYIKYFYFFKLINIDANRC